MGFQRKRRSAVRKSALLLGTALALAPVAALAAEAPTKVGEVVVTATKQTAKLRDTPISISVFDARRLDAAQVTTFDELSRQTPNLVMDDTLGGASISISNRGIRTPGSQAGFEGSTAVVIDGVYQARPAALGMALADLERVEVLRGPQGSLYGRNATAGVLNIITAGPTATRSGYAEAYAGSEGEYRVRAALAGPLGESGLEGRANLYFERRDAYAKAIAPDAGDENTDRTGLGLQFKGDVAGWSGRLVLRYFDYESNANSVTDLHITTPALLGFNGAVVGKPVLNDSIYARRNDQDFAGYEDIRKADLVLDASRDLGGRTLRSITGASWYEQASQMDADNTSVSGVMIGSNEEHYQVSEELHLSGEASPTVNYLLGVSAFYQGFDHNEPTVLGADWATYLFGAPFLAGAVDDVFSNQKTTNIGAFGQVNWRAASNLTFRLGLRGDNEDKDYTRNQPGSFLSNPIVANLSRSNATWSGALSATYAVTPRVNVYGSVNRGVKSGGFNFGATGTAADIPFSDETAVSGEVGLKGDFFDRRLSLSLAVFNSRFSDLQVTSFDGTTFRTENAASAKSSGVEAEATGWVSEGLQIGGSVGYLDARYDSYPNAQCAATDPNYNAPVCTQDLSGRPLAYAPTWSGSVWSELSGPLGADLRWRVRGEAAYRGEQYLSSNLDPGSHQSGYTIVNLNIGLENPAAGWEISIIGSNVFDEDYLQAFYNYPFFQGAYTAQPGAPARFGVLLRKTL